MARAAVGEIMRFLSDLANDENMRVTVTESVRGGCIAGAGAVVGGLLMGPPGLAIGGAVGGLVAAGTSTSFRPVAGVIAAMPPHQQEQLATQVRNILNNHDVQNLAFLAVTTGAAGAVRKEVVEELQRFITNEVQMTLA